MYKIEGSGSEIYRLKTTLFSTKLSLNVRRVLVKGSNTPNDKGVD